MAKVAQIVRGKTVTTVASFWIKLPEEFNDAVVKVKKIGDGRYLIEKIAKRNKGEKILTVYNGRIYARKLLGGRAVVKLKMLDEGKVEVQVTKPK